MRWNKRTVECRSIFLLKTTRIICNSGYAGIAQAISGQKLFHWISCLTAAVLLCSTSCFPAQAAGVEDTVIDNAENLDLTSSGTGSKQPRIAAEKQGATKLINMNRQVRSPRPVAYYSSSSQLSSNYLPIYAFDGVIAAQNGIRYWLSSADDAKPQWLMADFKRPFLLAKIAVHWKKDSASRNYALQHSLDGENWFDLAVELDGVEAPRLIHTLESPTMARFVRLLQPGGADAAEHSRKNIAVLEMEVFALVDSLEESFVNIASAARLQVEPFAGSYAHYLADDDLDTALQVQRDAAGDFLLINMLFGQVVPISRVELMRSPGSGVKMQVNLDTEGDGVFDLVGEKVETCEVGWNTADFPDAVSAAAISIRLEFIGKVNWWSGFPYINEVRVWSPRSDVEEQIKKSPSRINSTAHLLQSVEKLPPDTVSASENKILMGPWLNCFSIGLTPAHPRVNPKMAADVIGKVKAMGCNHIALEAVMTRFPGESFYRVPWESKVLRGVADSSIENFITDAQQAGLQVSMVLHRDVRPDPDGTFKVSEYNNDGMGDNLTGRTYRNFRKEIVREMLDLGCDGVSVLFDEGTVTPRYGNEINADEPVVELFRQASGFDFPPMELENTPRGRAYALFSYQQFADFYRELLGEVSRLKPDAFTWCNIQKSCLVQNARLRMNMAYDIVGGAADVDHWGTVVGPWRYYGKTPDFWLPAHAAKRFSGFSRKRHSGTLISVGYYYPWTYAKPWPASYFIGSALTSVFNGSRSLLYYRYNYLFANWHGADLSEYLRLTSRLLRSLQSRGMLQTEAPKRIAVVHSRASEDWWQLAHNGSNRGYFFHQAVITTLLKAGYHFDLLSLEREDHLAEFEKYDLLLLPFSYAISDSAVEALEKRVAASACTWIFGPDALADETGALREVPALQELTKNSPPHFLKDDADLISEVNQVDFADNFTKRLDLFLGAAKDWHFSRANDHDDVYFTFRRGEADDIFVLLVSYEDEPLRAELGFELPAGEYEVIRSEPDSDWRCAIDQASGGSLNHAALRRFAVDLAANSTVVLHIKKVGGRK